MTDVAYRALTAAEQVFYDLVWGPVVASGITAIQVAAPFFGWPVVGAITRGVLTSLSKWIYSMIVLATDVTAITLINSSYQAAYDKASIQLKIILIDRGIDSPEYRKARDEAKAALAQFISFGAAR